ncbi:unnamed protein product [Brachionus calyciflorus]|uniref:Uncharacterized protein n=1 Tax=Brachionus calyciflorus TaxID=104777 RepID=A0A814FE40_9BILA|nr:unnamed protein product [Brachionus calyciflorus]
MSINNLVVDLNPHEDPERENIKTTEQHEIGTDMSTISQTTICGHVTEVTTDKAITQTPQEINFALRDEVKLQIKDRPVLNFETVTQPMEYESLKSESSVTKVQNHCIKSHLKAQTSSDGLLTTSSDDFNSATYSLKMFRAGSSESEAFVF